MNKKLIMWGIIIASIIIIGIFIEILFNWLTRVKEETIKNNININENDSNGYEDVVVETKDVLNDFILSVISEIRNKNYDKIYDILDTDYRDYKFSNKDDLKKYLDELVKDNTKVELINYEKTGFKYLCLVRFVTDDKYDTRQFVLIEKYVGNYTLLFEDIIHIQKNTAFKNRPEMEVKFKYILTYSTYKTLVLNIKNNSSKEILIPYDDINVSYSSTYEDKMQSPYNISKDITVPANSEKTISLSFVYDNKEIRAGELLNLNVKLDKNSNTIVPLSFNVE
jgi:hypothetical protein